MVALGSILEEMRLDLSESEKQELDKEFEKEFGILGLSYCEKLEEEWEKNKSKIEYFIYNYIKRKRKKKKKQKEICIVK